MPNASSPGGKTGSTTPPVGQAALGVAFGVVEGPWVVGGVGVASDDVAVVAVMPAPVVAGAAEYEGPEPQAGRTRIALLIMANAHPPRPRRWPICMPEPSRIPK